MGHLGYFWPNYEHPFWYSESLVHVFHYSTIISTKKLSPNIVLGLGFEFGIQPSCVRSPCILLSWLTKTRPTILLPPRIHKIFLANAEMKREKFRISSRSLKIKAGFIYSTHLNEISSTHSSSGANSTNFLAKSTLVHN